MSQGTQAPSTVNSKPGQVKAGLDSDHEKARSSLDGCQTSFPGYERSRRLLQDLHSPPPEASSDKDREIWSRPVEKRALEQAFEPRAVSSSLFPSGAKSLYDHTRTNGFSSPGSREHQGWPNGTPPREPKSLRTNISPPESRRRRSEVNDASEVQQPISRSPWKRQKYVSSIQLQRVVNPSPTRMKNVPPYFVLPCSYSASEQLRTSGGRDSDHHETPRLRVNHDKESLSRNLFPSEHSKEHVLDYRPAENPEIVPADSSSIQAAGGRQTQDQQAQNNRQEWVHDAEYSPIAEDESDTSKEATSKDQHAMNQSSKTSPLGRALPDVGGRSMADVEYGAKRDICDSDRTGCGHNLGFQPAVLDPIDDGGGISKPPSDRRSRNSSFPHLYLNGDDNLSVKSDRTDSSGAAMSGLSSAASESRVHRCYSCRKPPTRYSPLLQCSSCRRRFHSCCRNDSDSAGLTDASRDSSTWTSTWTCTYCVVPSRKRSRPQSSSSMYSGHEPKSDRHPSSSPVLDVADFPKRLKAMGGIFSSPLSSSWEDPRGKEDTNDKVEERDVFRRRKPHLSRDASCLAADEDVEEKAVIAVPSRKTLTGRKSNECQLVESGEDQRQNMASAKEQTSNLKFPRVNSATHLRARSTERHDDVPKPAGFSMPEVTSSSLGKVLDRPVEMGGSDIELVQEKTLPLLDSRPPTLHSPHVPNSQSSPNSHIAPSTGESQIFVLRANFFTEQDPSQDDGRSGEATDVPMSISPVSITEIDKKYANGSFDAGDSLKLTPTGFGQSPTDVERSSLSTIPESSCARSLPTLYSAARIDWDTSLNGRSPTEKQPHERVQSTPFTNKRPVQTTSSGLDSSNRISQIDHALNFKGQSTHTPGRGQSTPNHDNSAKSPSNDMASHLVPPFGSCSNCGRAMFMPTGASVGMFCDRCKTAATSSQLSEQAKHTVISQIPKTPDAEAERLRRAESTKSAPPAPNTASTSLLIPQKRSSTDWLSGKPLGSHPDDHVFVNRGRPPKRRRKESSAPKSPLADLQGNPLAPVLESSPRVAFYPTFHTAAHSTSYNPVITNAAIQATTRSGETLREPFQSDSIFLGHETWSRNKMQEHQRAKDSERALAAESEKVSRLELEVRQLRIEHAKSREATAKQYEETRVKEMREYKEKLDQTGRMAMSNKDGEFQKQLQAERKRTADAQAETDRLRAELETRKPEDSPYHYTLENTFETPSTESKEHRLAIHPPKPQPAQQNHFIREGRDLFRIAPRYAPENVFFDIEAKRKEIAVRPSRKQTFGKILPYTRQERGQYVHRAVNRPSPELPKGYAIVPASSSDDDDDDTFEDRLEGEKEKARQKHKRVEMTLQEFLHVPDDPVHMLVDGKLAMKDGTRDAKGRLLRANKAHKVGRKHELR